MLQKCSESDVMYLIKRSQMKDKIYRDIFKYRDIYVSLYRDKYFLNIFSENIFNIYEAHN